MKKLFTLTITLLMVTLLVACSSESNKTAVTDKLNSNQGEEAFNQQQTEMYSNMVYAVGEDIPKGTYTIECTKTDYRMEIAVFASKKAYESFQKADKTTIGDYDDAIDAHSWADFYIEEDEEIYLGLKKGNMILLNDGMCEFNKYDAKAANTIYSGVYVVGEDIEAGKIDIKSTTDFLEVVSFENEAAYMRYRQANRDTNGEESDAIRENSLNYKFMYKDDVTTVDLEKGMVLMIGDGMGTYAESVGPVIN